MVLKYRVKLTLLGLSLIFILSCILHGRSKIDSTSNKPIKPVDCEIYNYRSTCLTYENNFYLPASQIVSIFDVYGFVGTDPNKYFFKPNNAIFNRSNDYFYNSRGKFLFFEKYNVELRPKVQMISVDENVPISNQWSPKGYKYPIQIAQFGLSHYSKWIDIKEKDLTIEYLDLLTRDRKVLIFTMAGKELTIMKNILTFNSRTVLTEEKLSNVYTNAEEMVKLDGSYEELHKFSTKDSDLPEVSVAGGDWVKGSALVFVLSNEKLGDMYLTYVCGDDYRSELNLNIFVYNIRNCSRIKLLRNLYSDIVKAIPTNIAEKTPNLLSELKNSSIKRILLFGNGFISTFKISNQFSYEKFLATADWFVNNQDSRGGWPTNAIRRIYANVQLAPGWYSAMAQGHGISVLMRAYITTSDERYLNAASAALHLFEVNSRNKGIRTYFFGNKKLVWYEEYPTTPSLFVLNGFIYSLFGLMDYVKLAKPGLRMDKATQLLSEGLSSLQTLLPLFDSGSGSFYDLRHATFPAGDIEVFKKQVRPWEVHDGPNRARTEYHLLHIEQLLYLGHTLDPANKAFLATADRFVAYLKGFRSSHN